MKMYERLIPEPVTLDDFADHFKRNVGNFDNYDHKKMFCGWMIDRFKMVELRDFFNFESHSNIFYYLKKHKEHMEADEIYRRKFQSL